MVLIVYAIIVEVNIVTMFVAALIPGLLAAHLHCDDRALRAGSSPGGYRRGGVSGSEVVAATLGVVPVFVVFGVVIGGIYAGIYSPTPAAAVGVARSPSTASPRRLSWRASLDSLLETARTTGMIYLILFGAALLKIFMSRAGVPQATAACSRPAASRRS